MPLGRPLHRRNSIGRPRLSAAQAWGFRVLGLRETAWFYTVGAFTAAVLLWSPSQATPLQPASIPTAIPVSHDLSFEALQELEDVVRGLVAEGTVGGSPSYAVNSRRAAPNFRVNRNGRDGRKPMGQATAFDVRSAASLAAGAAAQSLGDEGIETPLLRGDDSLTSAPGQGGSLNRQAGNPRRRR